MLEIIALVALCKWIGRILREKGRNPIGFQILGVVAWFGGEITGAIVVTIGVALSSPDGTVPDDPGPVVYLGALIGAVIGAAGAVTLAFLMPAVETEADPGGTAEVAEVFD